MSQHWEDRDEADFRAFVAAVEREELGNPLRNRLHGILQRVSCNRLRRIVQPVAKAWSRIIIDFGFSFLGKQQQLTTITERGAAAAAITFELGPLDVAAIEDANRCSKCGRAGDCRCFGCSIVLCPAHTVTVRVGKGDDVLEVAVCEECSVEAAGFMEGVA